MPLLLRIPPLVNTLPFCKGLGGGGNHLWARRRRIFSLRAFPFSLPLLQRDFGCEMYGVVSLSFFLSGAPPFLPLFSTVLPLSFLLSSPYLEDEKRGVGFSSLGLCGRILDNVRFFFSPSVH